MNDHKITVTRLDTAGHDPVVFTAIVPAMPDIEALAKLCAAVKKPRVRKPKP